MCGIAGIFRSDRGTVSPDLLRSMADAVSHRGPDGEGFFTAPGIGLAHRRLSVIDLVTGAQPLSRKDLGLTIAFNGELYNYIELREELEKLGHRFHTRSDTEVLLVARSQWGDDGFARLKGMFAFAIWDHRTNELLLARDPLGKKPLCVMQSGPATLSFASEAKALLRLPWSTRRMVPQAIEQYLELMYVPDSARVWADIERLEPGTWLKVSDAGVRRERYWRPRVSTDQRISFDDACATTEASISQATRIRLRSDVPLGIFLSGGVDSTLVALAASQLLTGGIRTFTVGFPGLADTDERPFARLVAERIGSTHHELDVRLDGPTLVHEVAKAFDEPFGDTSALPTLAMARETRRYATVVLSGDGGDELFGGYASYARQIAAGNLHPVSVRRRRLAAWVSSARGYARALPVPLASTIARVVRPYRGRIDSMADSVVSDPILRHVSLMRVAHWKPALDLLRPLLGARAVSGFPGLATGLPRQDDDIRTAMICDQLMYLPGDILKKVDIATMSTGLEVRSPLLDDDLIQLTHRLPREFLVSEQAGDGTERWGKRVLKALCARRMGEDFTYRQKRGFALPLQTWLNEPSFSEVVEAGFCGADSPIRSWFSVNSLSALWSDFRRGKRWLAQEVWNLIMLDAWAREYKPIA